MDKRKGILLLLVNAVLLLLLVTCSQVDKLLSDDEQTEHIDNTPKL